MLISILISNYNKEKFINNCLKSVYAQRYKNFEIILYDDNSTDNSLKAIKKFKKIKLLRNVEKKNIHPPLSQINSLINCFKKSKGKIICFLDSDDMFLKKKLETINTYFVKNKKKNFVVNYAENNNILQLHRFNYSLNKWPSIFPTSCISVRRDFFKQFMKFSKKKNFPNLEIDTRMTIFSCFYFDDFNIIKKKLTNYIFDDQGISSKYQFLSLNWWLKRKEAYCYLKFILKKKKKNFNKSLDYYVTVFIWYLIVFVKKLT